MSTAPLPAWLATWLDENSYRLIDYGDGTYKLMCALCATVPGMRDVLLADVEEYAREHPTNPCLDFAEWEVTS